MDYLSLFQDVLSQEAQAIDLAKKRVTQQQIDKMIALYDRLILSGGDLYICGVGKSGLIADKIAATFSSLGLPSYFLHPTEALHGDLGRINSHDAMIFISKSGSTEEILKLMPYLPITKENWIALVGNVKSEIAQKCSILLDASVEKEACLNNLAPTTSSTLALAIGDAMGVVFEKYRGVSSDKFAKNHPAGLLGKTLNLKVESLLVPMEQVGQVQPSENLAQAILQMTRYPTGICCVVNLNQELLGIIVEGDIRRALGQDESALQKSVDLLMNANPIVLKKTDLAFDALRIMESGQRLISVAPVLEGKKLLGVIRLHDLLKEGFSVRVAGNQEDK